MANKQYSSTTIMVITIVLSILLVIVIWPLSMIGKGSEMAASGDEAELRIQPVARVEMQQAEVKTDGKPRDGATVYNTICQACHATGAAGAPIAGDKAAWAPRIATGMESLIKSAINGKGAMPAKGGATSLTDAEVAAAVEHLVNMAK